MNFFKTCIAVALPVFALTGCVGFDQTMKQMQEAVAPVMINESLPQICQSVRDNPVKANDIYKNKNLTLSGKVSSIKYGLNPKYAVLVKSGNVVVYVGTNDQYAVKQLSVGQSVQVSGTVDHVSYSYKLCAITLNDSTF